MAGRAPSGLGEDRSPARRRISEALVSLCFERGFATVTVEELCARAGVEPAVFERLYEDLEDCFYETYLDDYGTYLRLEEAAQATGRSWRQRMRATAYALYRFLAASPERRHFHMMEIRAHPRALLVQEQGMQKMFDLIDEGRGELEDPGSLTRATAEEIGGGIFTQIYMAAGRGGGMPPEEEIVPKLMYAAVLPYLGAGAATEELEIPPPPR
jgi:AcrR family transcriptional regulator